MKIELDVSELQRGENEWEAPDLVRMMQEAVQAEAKKFVREMVREELGKVAGPVLRAKIAERAIQHALDGVDAMSDDWVVRELIDGSA